MSHTTLVEVTRGNDVECIHAGSVAVVDINGRVLYQAGDPDTLTFTRSTIKPFQALPFLRKNGADHFGYTQRNIALLCASHSGESMHTEQVSEMLKKIGCGESQLQCGCHLPMQYSAFDRLPPAGLAFNQLHNNCSGKHAGFLAYCVQHGQPLENYLDPSHPLQDAVRKSVADAVGVRSDELRSGTDGCSAPNYAMPLSKLAYGYAKLANADDGELSGIYDAMTTHPELISGTGRSDLAFMQAARQDWVAKIGADGVQVIGLRSAGLGIAIKIADGNMRALYTAAVSVLQQVGALKDVEGSGLAMWARPQLKNFRSLHTGEVRPAFKIAAA